jgi:hypothetical protein
VREGEAAGELGRTGEFRQHVWPDLLIRVGRDAATLHSLGRIHYWNGKRVWVLAGFGTRVQHGTHASQKRSNLNKKNHDLAAALKIPARMSIYEHQDSCRFRKLFVPQYYNTHNNVIKFKKTLLKKPQSVSSSFRVRVVVRMQLLQLLL